MLGLVDPDSDLAAAVEATGRAVVQLLSWPDRDLAEGFAGTAPRPAACSGRRSSSTPTGDRGSSDATTWAGVRLEDAADVGWSRLLTCTVEHVEVGDDADPLRAPARTVLRRLGSEAWLSAEGTGIRVMVVDDHPMWRDAVERDLQDHGFDVVGVAANGSEALARFPACRPHVVVLDLQIPAPNGVEVTAEVLRQDPSARVLILSASGEQEDVLDAVKAGATGYLVKSASRTELLDAVRRVAQGDTVFTPGPGRAGAGGVPAAVRARRPSDPDQPTLTERETEVLRMVAKGMSYKQIAERLVLSHRTVQNHVQNTLRKLQMHNRVELTRYAIAQGLDEDDADAEE